MEFWSDNKIDRRRFLNLAARGVAGSVPFWLLACASPDYTPQVRTTEPQPPVVPITHERIERIEKALVEIRDPLLEFCESQLNALRNSLNKPAELPTIVSTDSFPLQIVTQDYRNTGSTATSAAVMTIKEIKQDPPYKVFISTPAGSQEVPTINSINLRLQLGTTPLLRGDGPLYEGMFLAKELLTMLFTVQFGEDFYQYQRRNILVKDQFNNDVTDQTAQKQAGWSVMIDQTVNINSQVHKAIDLLPIYFLGSRILPLVIAGKLPAESRSITPMYKAAMILNNNQDFSLVVNNYLDKWLSSANILPPSGEAMVFSEPRFNNIIQQNPLY